MQRYANYSLTIFSMIIVLVSCAIMLPAAELPIEASHDVIVVGAGSSGLTSAYYLKDYDVKILERNDYTGGSTMSAVYEDISYPIGVAKTTLSTLLLEIAGDLGLHPIPIPNHDISFFNDGTIYYGLEGLMTTFIEEGGLEEWGRFYVTSKAAYFLNYYSNPETAELDQITAKQWFDNEQFAPLFYKVYDAKARLLFGAGLEEVSALSLLPIIFQDADSLPIGLGADDINNDPISESESATYFTFPSGMTEYTNAIAEALSDKIQLNSNVESITKDGEWMRVIYSDPDGTQHALQSRAVILAIPAYIVGYLAPEILSEEQKTLLNQIEYSSYCIVSLFGDEPIFGDAFDLQFTDGMLVTDLIDQTWALRKNEIMPEGSDVQIYSAIIAPTSYQDQSFKELTQEELIEKVYTDLETFDPDVRTKVDEYRVDWFSSGAPVMTVGARQRLARLQEITNGSLALCGSYMIYPDFNATITSGYNAAQQTIRVIKGQSAIEFFELY